jgi:hypothetical protein
MKPQLLKFLAITALCLITSIPFAGAATYYLSSSQGNDTNAGTSSGAPWQTMSNVWYNSSGFGPKIFKPGDSILLKAGDSFDGPLVFSQSGTAGSPITVDRYGTGANPIIYGDHPTATWSAVPGHPGIYSAFIGNASMINLQYAYDYSGHLYTKSVQGGQTIDNWLDTFVAYTWGGTSNVYLQTPSGNSPAGNIRIIEHAAVYPGFLKYVTFQNLEICHGFIGMEPAMSSYFIAQNNYIHDVWNSAIYFEDCVFSVMASNTVNNTGSDSLYLAYGGNNWIHHNVCSNSGVTVLNIPPAGDRQGIGLQQGTNDLIEYNSLFYMHGSCFDYYYEVNSEVRFNYGFSCGQAADTDGTGLLFHHNIFDLNGIGKGILCAQAYNPSISPVSNNIPQVCYNNVVYNYTYYGLYTDPGLSAGVVMRNNIVVATQPGQGMALLYPGVDSDYNLYYCTAGSLRGWQGNGSLYSTLSAMQTGSGQETHSVYAAPQFVSTNPVTAVDFIINPSSPCAFAGQNLMAAGLLAPTVGYLDYLGTSIPQGAAPDIGAYELVLPTPPTDLHIVP